MRAAFGAAPTGGLAALSLAGFLGAAWLILQARHPELPGGIRFLGGFAQVWETAGMAVVFAFSIYTLQPGGPGDPAPIGRSFGIVATAGVPASVVALVGGLLGFAMPLFMPAALWGKFAVGTLGLSILWSVLLAGRGIAMRRGASPAVGAGAAVAALVVSLLVLGLVVWLHLNSGVILGVTPTLE
jgi:hypothetical protein